MAARRPKGPKGRKAPRRTAKKKRPAARAAAKAIPRKRAPAKRKTAATRKRPATPNKTQTVSRKKTATGTRRRTAAKRSPARPSRTAPSRERLAAGVPVEVGVVTHWFPRSSAAVVRLSHPIHRGDTIHVRGQHTDFVQQVESLALEGQAVGEGLPLQEVGLRVEARVRRGDRVYRVSW
jgi:hypothetical protein